MHDLHRPRRRHQQDRPRKPTHRYTIPGTPTLVIDFKNANASIPHLSWAEAEAAIDAALAAKGVK